MPIYTLTSPSGKTYKIEGPAGASQQEVMGQLIKNSPNFASEFTKSLATDNPTAMPNLAVTQAQKDKLAKAGTLDKLGLNFGAGANSILQGAKQVLGMGSETPDEAIQRQNQQDALKKSVRGGGLMQGVGQAAMTAPAMAIPGVGESIPGAAAGMAAQGATQGLLEPAQNPQDRLRNMAVGGVAAPVIGGAMGAVGSAAKPIINALRPNAAAASKIVKASGGSADDLASALRGDYSPNPAGVSPTVAQQTGNAGIASLEATSRSTPGQAGGWAMKASEQNAARSDFLKNLGGNTADALTAAKDARDAATKPLREAAIGYADAPGRGFGVQAKANIGDAEPTTPEGQAAWDSIKSKWANKDKITAQDLHDAHTALNKNVNVNDPGIGEIKDGLTKTLDTVSKGRYGDYMQMYALKSQDVNAAQALKDVKGVHWSDHPDAVQYPVGSGIGVDPQISGQSLTDALRKQEAQQYGMKMDPAHEQAVRDLAEEQTKAQALGAVPAAGGGSGGLRDALSNVAVPAAIGGTVAGAPFIGAGMAGLGMAGKAAAPYFKEKQAAALASMLRDPQALAAHLAKAQAPAGGDAGVSLADILRQQLTQGAAGYTPSPTGGVGVLNQGG
jgi:hypothetical protein